MLCKKIKANLNGENTQERWEKEEGKGGEGKGVVELGFKKSFSNTTN